MRREIVGGPLPSALAVVLLVEAGAQAADQGCSISVQENGIVKDVSALLECGAEAEIAQGKASHRNGWCWKKAHGSCVLFLAGSVAREEEGQPRCEDTREEDMDGVAGELHVRMEGGGGGAGVRAEEIESSGDVARRSQAVGPTAAHTLSSHAPSAFNCYNNILYTAGAWTK